MYDFALLDGTVFHIYSISRLATSGKIHATTPGQVDISARVDWP